MKPSIKIFSTMLKEVPTIIWRSQYHFKTTYDNHLLNDFLMEQKRNLQMIGQRVVGQWPRRSLSGFCFQSREMVWRPPFYNFEEIKTLSTTFIEQIFDLCP